MSTKDKIISYLKYRGWTSGTQLENQAHSWRTKGSTISRRARELADEGKINRKLNGKTVAYATMDVPRQEKLIDMPEVPKYRSWF